MELSTKEKSNQKRKSVNNENNLLTNKGICNLVKKLFPVINTNYIIIMFNIKINLIFN